jgi:hypothetical protein
MTVRAAFVLGLFLLLAALVRGGFYSAGHDFVVNRFTGQYQFVPAEDEEEGAALPTRGHPDRGHALTSRRPGVRVEQPGPQDAWREVSTGR